MRKLPVDLDELATALEHHDGGLRLSEYWFDTLTGAVLFVSTDLEEDKEIRDQIAEDVADRFVRIEPIESRDEFQVMAEFVRSLPREFDFPKFHGLLTALVVGPVQVSAQEILEKIVSHESKANQPTPNDVAETEQVLGLIARLQNEIAVDLRQEMFEPAYSEREHASGEIYPDTFSWCEGFVLGMSHAGQAWKKWYKDSRRELAISTIQGAARREFRSEPGLFETPEKMWALYELIRLVVPLIRYFWCLESGLDELAGTGTQAKSQPKVGRNAPCPCGSGKKFKHCCGEARGG